MFQTTNQILVYLHIISLEPEWNWRQKATNIARFRQRKTPFFEYAVSLCDPWHLGSPEQQNYYNSISPIDFLWISGWFWICVSSDSRAKHTFFRLLLLITALISGNCRTWTSPCGLPPTSSEVHAAHPPELPHELLGAWEWDPCYRIAGPHA